MICIPRFSRLDPFTWSRGGIRTRSLDPRAGQNRERLIFEQMAHLVYTKSAAFHGASIRRGRTRTHHVTARKRSSITARFSKFSKLFLLFPPFSLFPKPRILQTSTIPPLTFASQLPSNHALQRSSVANWQSHRAKKRKKNRNSRNHQNYTIGIGEEKERGRGGGGGGEED